MDRFQLQWADFDKNLTSCIKEFRDEDDLCDVTLVCDDDQVKAHKIILSASSTFFQSVIKRNPHAHPLLYIRGIRSEDLKSLLDFMYLGKTEVAQDKVDTFLSLGEELGIKGLAGREQGLKEEEQKNSVENNEERKQAKDNDRFVKHEISVEEDILVTNNISFESIEQSTLEENIENIENEASDMSPDCDVASQVEKLLTKVNIGSGKAGWKCTQCGKYSRFKHNLQKHIEIHIEGLCFPCKHCGRTFKTSNSLNSHSYTNQACRAKRMSAV